METTNKPEAYIAVGKTKNRQKIYSDNKVYLNSGTEFQIELFNPTSQTIAVKIYLNGQAISNRMLVLKPGERDFLDRYIDSDRRLKFDTYNVDGSKEAMAAIKDNGNVRIEFFKEKQVPIFTTSNNYWVVNPTITIPQVTFPYTYPQYGMYYNNTPNFFNPSTSIVSTGSATGGTASLSNNTKGCNSMDWCVMDSVNTSGVVETGRVEQGSKSDQAFNSYFGEFESYYSWSTAYQIIPETYRPVEMKELRHYCPGCGTRIKKSSWRFCSQCGEKLD